MKTIPRLVPALLLVAFAFDVSAQPPLSKLPQAEPPIIADSVKQIINQQWAANNAASKNAVQSTSVQAMKASTPLARAAGSENIDNQKAYINDLKRHAAERN